VLFHLSGDDGIDGSAVDSSRPGQMWP